MVVVRSQVVRAVGRGARGLGVNSKPFPNENVIEKNRKPAGLNLISPSVFRYKKE